MFGRLVRRFRLWREQHALAEEIEHHRRQRQDDFESQGMSRAEAVAASRRAMGNTTLVLRRPATSR